METQRQRVMNRLFLDLPAARYVCFYPMNKRRGEALNWYSESFERRASMMREHGMIGRHYAGRVTQVISGSIGFDDWEWGVDLFAQDPARVQEADLRDALRRGEREVRGVRPVLYGPAVRPPATGRLPGRPRPDTVTDSTHSVIRHDGFCDSRWIVKLGRPANS